MPIVCIFMGCLLCCFATFLRCAKTKWQRSSLSLVPGGAARRSPNRATGGVAGYETTSSPGGVSPSNDAAADHPISYFLVDQPLRTYKGVVAGWLPTMIIIGRQSTACSRAADHPIRQARVDDKKSNGSVADHPDTIRELHFHE